MSESGRSALPGKGDESVEIGSLCLCGFVPLCFDPVVGT